MVLFLWLICVPRRVGKVWLVAKGTTRLTNRKVKMRASAMRIAERNLDSKR